MLPAMFLIAITLPLMAAVELRLDTFVILMILVCAAAGLTAPAGRGHVAANARRPMDASNDLASETDDTPLKKTATHIRESALAR
ncbi:hypothetical protein E0H22_17360 [Rhodopseudomonas boonkerdii]|uniref:hypothetical protein n=1 Tax=Rhodopseudomonas boonkerdii TaxID=475937 RepID=UPI001E5C3399|nr:hypothetical protein [Rhodopseudomonas boonkerdii]UGV27298.1 hypothetical protein E0H22_17360 [Rhodopseudomonas boonkerdii]